MEEKKFVKLMKDEFNIKEFVKRMFGKGKISNVQIEYTPLGEKIIVATHRPGLVIGKKGEKIEELTDILKRKFKMENPHITIEEIKRPEYDSQIMADEIALELERFGLIRFKSIAYKYLGKIKNSGALGCEIRTGGKLPSDRAKSWRFGFGYLKKTGDSANVVSKAQSTAFTMMGVAGIKVEILAPTAILNDKIELTDELMNKIKQNRAFAVAQKSEKEEAAKKKPRAKKAKKKEIAEEKVETVSENKTEESAKEIAEGVEDNK
jgi:small subunit ribosomal protein S3